MNEEQALFHLRRANAVARRSMDEGRHAFGVILVDGDGQTVLLEQGNVSAVEHAESLLARTAAARFPPERLWACTLVTTVEPCAMCAGTQYWATSSMATPGSIKRSVRSRNDSRARAVAFSCSRRAAQAPMPSKPEACTLA
jgi:pyrimidine deaminase RibD-like protein